MVTHNIAFPLRAPDAFIVHSTNSMFKAGMFECVSQKFMCWKLDTQVPMLMVFEGSDFEG
jgi:hypothetical protein